MKFPLELKTEKSKKHYAIRFNLLWIFHLTFLITLVGGTHITFFVGVDIVEVSFGFGFGDR